MCGIAAEFSPLSLARPLALERMRHRGPDDSGSVLLADGHVWLGHCRLAILDLSPAGAQPMEDPLTGNTIVFNGEIYNHLALRRDLEARARISWRGHSDTETLLAAYRIWGEGMLPQLKGMFAFAIYDKKQRQLWVVRDRLGIKPLYFAEKGETLHLASEVRVLRERIDAQPTREAIAAYLRFGCCPEETLLYPEIRSLPAGGWLKAHLDGRIEHGCYWPPPTFEPRQVAPSEAPRLIRGLLEQSVREHLLSDVPVAALLSGGIDSSIVTALAAQASSSPLHTFSVGFAERGFDETAVAQEVASRYGTRHERIELIPSEILTDVTEAVSRMDLPSVDAINTYIVTKRIAQRGIKVVLSGLGGDELFGGYPVFGEMPRLQALSRAKPLWNWAAPLFGAHGDRLRDMPGGGDALRIAGWRRTFWTRRMLEQAGLPAPEISFQPPPSGWDAFAETSWAELTGYMRHMLLRDSDQMSMAHSQELRVPFLDHELVEAILRLPSAEKTRGSGIKPLLVESCRDLLPAPVFQRPKMGFSLPMDEWMRGPLHEFVHQGILKAANCGIDLKYAEEALASRRIHWTRTWAAAVLGHVLT